MPSKRFGDINEEEKRERYEDQGEVCVVQMLDEGISVKLEENEEEEENTDNLEDAQFFPVQYPEKAHE